MTDKDLIMRDGEAGALRPVGRSSYSEIMHATYEVGSGLTRRLTVDHGRMRSSLCRMS